VRVSSSWSLSDLWGAVRCRLGGRYCRRYRVAPGLYALGRPAADSPVLLSASYKLSFDLLRRDLGGKDCWILVLDTGGLGVACAIAAGTFSTDEVALRIGASHLQQVVSHRRVIAPQLAAGSLEEELVERHTGFEVLGGPLRSADIPAYLDRGCLATDEMRRSRFGVVDRLALVPQELVRSLARFPAFALASFVLAGFTAGGLDPQSAWQASWPLGVLGLCAALAGSLLAPLLTPCLLPLCILPAGWSLGAGTTAALMQGAGLARGMDRLLLAACYAFFPAASAAMALSFIRAAPAGTSVAPAWQMRLSLAALGVAACLSLLFLGMFKARQWG
jgi:hypothetical protein